MLLLTFLERRHFPTGSCFPDKRRGIKFKATTNNYIDSAVTLHVWSLNSTNELHVNVFATALPSETWRAGSVPCDELQVNRLLAWFEMANLN